MGGPNGNSNDSTVPEGDKTGWKTAASVPAVKLLEEEAQAIDPEVGRRVLRKIDLFLMPAMVLGKKLS